VPLSNILNKFWSENTDYASPIVDRVNQIYQINGNENGADLNELSTL
jgi:hypothetical protein